MSKTEKALVMRDVPSNGQAPAIELHPDIIVASTQVVQLENESQRRMNLELHSMLIAATQGVLDELKSMRGQVADVFKMRIDLAEQVQKSLDREEDRNLKRAREESTIKMLEQAGHGLLAIMPGIVGKFTGSKIPEPMAAKIQPLIASITPNQWEKLAEVFEGEQLIALKGIVDAMPDLPTEPLRQPEIDALVEGLQWLHKEDTCDGES